MATSPRRIIPGTTWFVTRRCSERRFFLRPSKPTNEIVVFALGRYSKLNHVDVHVVCVMSNHMHLLVTDVEGRLPEFMRNVDALIARGVNASIGHSEGFWESSCSYSAVDPQNPSDVLGKIVYILANPVAAGLVRRGADWPGLWTGPEQIGTTTLVARRPEALSSHGDLPATAELELKVPPGFASGEEFRAKLSAALRAVEEEHQARLASEGRRFVGAALVCAMDPFKSPSTVAPRFTLKPRIAAKDPLRRMAAISRLKDFKEQYRKARASFCAGIRDVVFPAGTYLMRIMYGVQCAGAA